jgi:hypothetical protein
MIPSELGNFTPQRPYAGAVLWLDAQDLNLGFSLSGSNITSWFDKSRNGHQSLPSGGNYPQLYTDGNGLRWARGWSQLVYLNVTPVIPANYAAGYTVVAVVRPQSLKLGGLSATACTAYGVTDTSTSPIHEGLLLGVDSAGRAFFSEDCNGSVTQIAATNPYPTPGLVTAPQIAVLVSRRDPAGPTMHLQATGQAPATTAGLAATGQAALATTVGNADTRFTSYAYAFPGDIAEIIVFPSFLSDAQVKVIVYQLNAKYGIAQAPVAGMSFWFDAQDPHYGFNLSGSTVLGWQDKAPLATRPGAAQGSPTESTDSSGINWLDSLSSSNYINWSSNNPNVDFSVGFTIFAVVDPTGAPTGDGIVQGQWGSSSGYDQYSFDVNAVGQAEFYEQNLGGSGSLSVLSEDPAPLNATQVWHCRHIPAPSPGVPIVSIQQSQEAIQSYAPGITPTAAPIGNSIIGRWANFASTPQVFPGKIAEVLLYNGPLTDAQVASIRSYLETKFYIRPNMPPPGYKLWLDAQDTNNGLVTTGTGPGSPVTTWYDKSGGFRNGTGVGSPRLYIDAAGFNWVEGFTASDYIDVSPINVGLAIGYTLFVVVLPIGAPTASEGVAYGTWTNSGIPQEAQWLAVEQSNNKVTAFEYQEGGGGSAQETSVNPAAYGTLSIWHSRHDPVGPLLTEQVTGEAVQSIAGCPPGNGLSSSTHIGNWPNGAGPRPFNGRVAEVLFYPFTMTDAQVLATRLYLKRKYAPQPLPVQGATLWLDAQDVFNGVKTSTPDSLTATGWTDKSGAQRAVTAAGSPTILTDVSGLRWATGFSGSNYFNVTPTTIPIDLSKGYTIFTVVRPTSLPGSEGVIYGTVGGSGNDQVDIEIDNTGSVYVDQGNGSTSQGLHAAAHPVLGSPTVLHTRSIPGGLLTFQRSGEAVQSVAALTGGGASTGATTIGTWPPNTSLFFTGDIGDVVVFPFALSDAQVTLVRNYLEKKYGLTQPVPGMVLWLDGQDPVNGFQTSGSNITAWTDKSGKGHTVSVNIALSTITEGGFLYSQGFSSSGNGFSVTPAIPAGLDTGYTHFVVVYPTGVPSGANGVVYGTGSGSQDLIAEGIYIDDRVRLAEGSLGFGVSVLESPSSSALNTPSIWHFRCTASGAALSLKQSGDTTATGTGTGSNDPTASNTTIGNWNYSGYNPFTGYIAEVIIYNRALTDAEVAQVRIYLSLKYGIPT